MSGATSGRKGSRAEVAVVHALRRAGWQADTSRNVLDGRRTGDDIVWDGPASIEVKVVTKLDLSGWLRQALEKISEEKKINRFTIVGPSYILLTNREMAAIAREALKGGKV